MLSVIEPGCDDLERVVALPTGTLTVKVNHGVLPLDEICDFAARPNPKRGFLFVSKILGKHIPVRTATLTQSYELLASRISCDLPGPVVFVGMAETAIAMGHGVFSSWRRLTGRNDAMFLHTTRYRIEGDEAFGFLEEHSHAADHIVYRPEDPTCFELFEKARSLVLVDDEASTGKTFVNLSNAFAVGRDLQAVVPVVLTDWRGNERSRLMEAAMPAPGAMVSLLDGKWDFEPDPAMSTVKAPDVRGNGASKDDLAGRDWGRLGLIADPSFNVDLPRVREGEKVLVLGTGEFAYAAYLVARKLEGSGASAWVQSTTRSPIMQGHAISDVLEFQDNYDDGIVNFLYNSRIQPYDRVLICTETPEVNVDQRLVSALNADILRF